MERPWQWRRVDCPLLVKDELLPQTEEIEHFGVLLTNVEKREREINRQISAALARAKFIRLE